MNDPGHGEPTDDDGYLDPEKLEQGKVRFNLVGPVEGQNLEGQEEEREIVEHGNVFHRYRLFMSPRCRPDQSEGRKLKKKLKLPLPAKDGCAATA